MTRKIKPQPTSIKAFRSLKSSKVKEIYEKIAEALKILGTAHTEKIADYLGIAHSKIHKRVSEMERIEIIWRPGLKLPMKSGRNAFVWQLRGDHQAKTEAAEKMMKGTTVSDYSKKKEIKQSKLFI